MPEIERAGFLDQACGDDGELRATLERMLRAAEDDDSLLEIGRLQGGKLWRDVQDGLTGTELSRGSRVGVYEVVEEIGRGGMAVVYAAHRVDGGFEQEVAVKVLKRGIDTDEVLRRFEQERQILASLNHPAIAQLIDGGVTDDGTPFLVMERVEGHRVDTYCAAHDLAIEQRLRLFITIGRAVAHAHRRLVVHRDLKPSNILVADAEGEEPHVKLLDFGIAKLVDPQPGTTAAPATRTLVRPMTPEYATPEQVRGEAVTTATDVYQLGLLLYELLTGRRPFARGDITPAEMERRICDEDPPAPSTAVAKATGESSFGGVDPAQLRKLRHRLKGDLDKIVLMALRKEPERRYLSVQQLVDDVERYLDGRPVSAHRSSWSYRLGKFLRRNAAVVVATTLMSVLALVLAVVFTVRLAQERARVQLEANRSNRVATFLTDLFALSTPERALGETITAREILDRGRESIVDDLEEDPEIKASMLMVIGQAYTQLSLYDEATPLFEQATEIRRSLGTSEIQRAESLVAYGRSLYLTGDFASSQGPLEEALAIHQAADSEDQQALAEAPLRLGMLRRRQDRIEEAKTLVSRAVALQESNPDGDRSLLGRMFNSLGLVLGQAGENAEARTAYERSIAIHQELHGADHPSMSPTLGNLGALLTELGDFEAARSTQERALALARQYLGDSHINTGNALLGLGQVIRRAGSPDEAWPYVEEAAAAYERAVGPDHVYVSWALLELAALLRETGEGGSAGELYDRALAIRIASFGEGQGQTTRPLRGKAEWCREEGDLDCAEAAYRRLVEIRRQLHPDGHVQLFDRLADLGDVLAERGDCAAAGPVLKEAIDGLRTTSGEEDKVLLRAKATLEACR